MKNCREIENCSGRREFIFKAALSTGTVMLTLLGIPSTGLSTGKTEDLTIRIDEKSPLKKVGGSAVFDSSAGKISIVRTSETEFVAFSAVCTHKRGIVAYDPAKKQFVCPKHGSTFDAMSGKPMSGPAEVRLSSFPSQGTSETVTVTLKINSNSKEIT